MAEALTDEEWAVLVARHPNGLYYGVRTTRIICQFGCASVPPKRENCVLFDDLQMAVDQGFRACKRCRPDVVKGKV